MDGEDMTDELDKKKQFRDAMWNYFGITEDNDLKWYEDIYESVVQPFCEQECNKARIDELKEVEIACHNSPDPYTYARKLTYQDFLLAKDRRLAELSNKENK